MLPVQVIDTDTDARTALRADGAVGTISFLDLEGDEAACLEQAEAIRVDFPDGLVVVIPVGFLPRRVLQ